MHEDFGFIEGFIFNKDRIVVVVSSAKLEEDGVEHAFVCDWKDGAWNFWDEDFSVVKVCVYCTSSGLTLIEMGSDGEIRVADASGFRDEIINTTPESPSRLRPLNDIRLIGNHIYVTGMRRQVFRRRYTASTWERCDGGVLVPRTSKEVAGFLSIDGFNDSEIYAVGYRGQIWRFDGSIWSRIASPTNMRLESVRCIDGRSAIAVGDQGLILIGRNDQWDVVKQDIIDETLTDIEEVRGSVFISTEIGSLYKLDGLHLIEIDTGLGKEITTANLHSDGKTLLSVGERNLLLFDGSVWWELPHPPLPPV